MIRIKDIADELGVSTATVSNVIHGKTKKISDETVRRVQALLEEKQYIPNMAAVLLAQNSSKIICFVISAHQKYENKLLQDPFICALLNELSYEIERNDYFMMIKQAKEINEVIQYASMWNMAGLVISGFCKQDYDNLRQNIRIPFVVMDGFFEPHSQCANIGIDNEGGGYQVGRYLLHMGHQKVLFVADNDEDMDHERYMGLMRAFDEAEIIEKPLLQVVSIIYQERILDYEKILAQIGSITAIFCASDAYAIEVMDYLLDRGVQIPEQVSIVGFDDIPAAVLVRPKLTTVKQDIKERAKKALAFLKEPKEFDEKNITLNTEIVIRESVKNIKNTQMHCEE